MICYRSVFVAAPLCAALISPVAIAIPAAVQDFEDGTTLGWTAGGGPVGGTPLAGPTVVPGGMGGAADDFLRLTAVGDFGPGSRLSAINRTSWSGDYTAAGLTTIGMRLGNFGVTDLYIRLLIEDLTGLAQIRYAITDAVFLPSASGWMNAGFSVAPADLTSLQGDITALLASVTQIRILGSADPDWLFSPGLQPSVNATLGVDDIAPNVFGQGDGVNDLPEPAIGWLLALGLIGALGHRPRRNR
jgi:hypothetical protein